MKLQLHQFLLDAAIKSAASVKIVYLEDFSNFQKGLTRVSDIVKLLNRITSKEDIPIYCLFNRYVSTSPTKMTKLFQSNDMQKNQIVKEELQVHAKKLVLATKKNSEKLFEKAKQIYDHYASSDHSNDQEINEIMSEISQITNSEKRNEAMIFERSSLIIQNNFEAGRFCYIDPTSKWSVENARKEILQMPNVDKSKLSFNYCDQQRSTFSRSFEKTLQENISPLINDIFLNIIK